MNAVIEQLVREYPDLAAAQADIQAAVDLLVRQFQQGRLLLVAGNGGSAADAEHIVGELMKGCTLRRPLEPELQQALEAQGAHDLAKCLQGALPAIALNSHTALITAIVNDIHGSAIFAQQVLGYGHAGDVLWAISTSGNAPDILNALQVARVRGLHTIGLSGQSGGRMAPWCDILIRVPYQSTQTIQERHLPIYHAICVAVERELFSQ
jgi:phosphoheptose isomerase